MLPLVSSNSFIIQITTIQKQIYGLKYSVCNKRLYFEYVFLLGGYTAWLILT
jgi:hypothetical protein